MNLYISVLLSMHAELLINISPYVLGNPKAVKVKNFRLV